MHKRDFLRLSAMGSGLALGASLIGTRIALAANAQGWPAQSFAASSVEQVLQDLFQMRTVPESDRVHVRSAKEVDDALSVPVSVSVDHPMTDDDYIARIYVLVDHNPTPLASIFHCSPANGKAACYQRIKVLHDSPLRVIAQSNRGDIFAAKPEWVHVKRTGAAE
ncbi:thiosulfate oxidation carrier protein SoxY [Acidithiobacillus sp. AMEEHan]|uniref:thiosulfate oxidation carrier protein SoxY n=1 Tax=Acidithiobacillus sp. AMEEHan TaxID=2994951 RepID=UPI0027E4FDA2|nr:thiosulfate oxidation carrier protein SoxY [Acidithiobacillus sp. AMEEHan]